MGEHAIDGMGRLGSEARSPTLNALECAAGKNVLPYFPNP